MKTGDLLDAMNQPHAYGGSALDALLAAEIAKDSRKLIILDDDPTGVQTVHDVSVYTDWSEQSIREGFEEPGKLFYILTNSRGMTVEETTHAHQDIAHRTAKIAAELGRDFLIMSRSDSTLRGYYPLETTVLRDELQKETGRAIDGEILCPFFMEGGRYTIGNVHYVRSGDEFIPASQTEFAKDKTFGYSHSSLPEYIEEKTDGMYRAASVACIPLEMERAGDIDGIVAVLMQARDFSKICVNAADYDDIKVFAIAMYRAMAKGKSFIFRTAAGMVKVMGGVSDQPLLTRKALVTTPTRAGGLVIVGSHMHKTTMQLDALLELDNTVPIAFDSDLVLKGGQALSQEVDRCVELEEKVIREGRTAVCYTKRTLLTVDKDTKQSALIRARKISDAVFNLVARLQVTPAFIIAKGGITSSDVGVKALNVRRANVMGQISPGVPVWQTGSESKFPQLPYIIFPGNVGEITTLRDIVQTLM